jgi:membrane protein implicated in regulation of membrane protease activity
MTEVAGYTLLGAAIASTIFVVGGRPIWHVALVGLAALIIIVLSAVISHRVARPHRPDLGTNTRDAGITATPSATSRRGRRRRR